jgi:protein ImuA
MNHNNGLSIRRPMLDPGKLQSLRRKVAQIEADGAPLARQQALSLGAAAIDAALGGGLALGAMHEISPALPMHLGTATGFVVALARLAGGHGHAGKTQLKIANFQNETIAAQPALWIQQDFAAREAGGLYGPGLDLFGLPMPQLIVLRVTKPRDALWAMEEALKSGAVSSVIMELVQDDAGIDLTATRRLSLAAAEGGALGLILRHRDCDCPSAALTRWQVAAAPGARDSFGGLGTTALALSLVKNRHGPTGRWLLSWDRHECGFIASVSLGLAAAARDRPDRVPLAHAG